MTMESTANNAGKIIGVSDADVVRIRTAIQRLPDTVPPRAVWDRVEELGRAEGLLGNRYLKHTARWVAGAAVAATVAMLAIRVPGPIVTPDDAATFTTVPSYLADAQSFGSPSLQTLKVQSQQLERDLRSMPNPRRVVRASTAATMAQIEDRIAMIDYQINYPGSQMTSEQHRAYWQERVRLMNVLVQLRYAQAQKTAF